MQQLMHTSTRNWTWGELPQYNRYLTMKPKARTMVFYSYNLFDAHSYNKYVSSLQIALYHTMSLPLLYTIATRHIGHAQLKNLFWFIPTYSSLFQFILTYSNLF